MAYFYFREKQLIIWVEVYHAKDKWSFYAEVHHVKVSVA